MTYLHHLQQELNRKNTISQDLSLVKKELFNFEPMTSHQKKEQKRMMNELLILENNLIKDKNICTQLINHLFTSNQETTS